jgi:GntR family transcriptional regulator, rspAB operon transcriptional repressor
VNPNSSLPKVSKAELVYATLRNEIIELIRAPGDFIDKARVCDQLGVSRFPVAEALGRLARDKLVDVEPQRGSYVSLIRRADIEEALFLRAAVEAKALASLSTIDIVFVATRLREEISAQRAAAEANDPRAFVASDVRFHEALVARAGIERANELVASFRAHTDRARHYRVAPTRWEEALGEHERIVAAMERGDVAGAGAALADHMEGIRRQVLMMFSADGAFLSKT